jgi:hypothetical protein
LRPSGRCERQVLDDQCEQAKGAKIDPRPAHGSTSGVIAADRAGCSVNTHRRVAGVGLGLLAALCAAGALYASRGHQFVAEAVTQGRRIVLRNLLAHAGPFTTQDYLSAADHLAGAIFVVWLLIGGALVAWPLADRLMAGVYRRVSEFGEGGFARRPGAVAVGSIIVLVALIGIAQGVLRGFPNSGDEYCYLYQAETFARGRVANTPDPLPAFFDLYHVREVDGRLFSVFPPGWPAVLALALAARVPLWLVNPVLGLLTLGLTGVVGRRLYGRRAAVVAVVGLAASPFFLFNSASYFAHALCAVQVLAFAWFGLRALDGSSARWAMGAGAALGAALVTRNYTAVCCALPFGLALVRRGRPGWRLLWAAALAGLPFVAVTIVYNQATMGHPLANATAGLETYDRFWFPDGWLGRALGITIAHLGRFVAWTPPVLLFLLPTAWRAHRRASGLRFTDGLFPALVAGYFFYVNRGGNQYGPRFYYEALPFVVLAVTAFLMQELRYEDKTPARRFAWYAFAISVLACVPITLVYAGLEHGVVKERAEPYTLVATQGVDNAVIFLASGSGWVHPMRARDLTRNNPDRSNRVLYVHDAGADNARLMAAYPGRSYFRYRFDPITRRGSLEPLPPSGSSQPYRDDR